MLIVAQRELSHRWWGRWLLSALPAGYGELSIASGVGAIVFGDLRRSMNDTPPMVVVRTYTRHLEQMRASPYPAGGGKAERVRGGGILGGGTIQGGVKLRRRRWPCPVWLPAKR